MHQKLFNKLAAFGLTKFHFSQRDESSLHLGKLVGGSLKHKWFEPLFACLELLVETEHNDGEASGDCL